MARYGVRFQETVSGSGQEILFRSKTTGTDLAGFAVFFKDSVEHLRERLGPRLDIQSNVAG